ncbi:hypothetical protein KKC97_01515 [bacterium]|nr:hypothetical protein [bacterium]
MKRLIYFSLLALIVAFVSITLAQSGFQYRKPSSFDEDIQLIISGKTRHYFVLDQDSHVEVTVKGPSKLKVMSRLVLADKQESGDYQFIYQLDDSKKLKTVSHKTVLSDKVEYKDSHEGGVSVLRKRIIDVPRGSHTYRFSLPVDSKHTLFMRFSQKTNEFTGGTPVVAMTPFQYTTSVDLVSREESYTYYRVSDKDRVVLKLVGPATMKVLSRIEFDSQMQGKQKWKIQLLEDGSEKRVYNLSATKSEVNAYREEIDLVPSHAEIFFIEIPKGEHVYEFKLPENHRSAILRFLLPESQLDGN